MEQTLFASQIERLRKALRNSVSHDMCAPLAAIIRAAGSLVEPGQGSTNTGRTADAETMLSDGERLDRNIQKLLYLTRLGLGAVKAHLVACDLADLIGSARQRLRGQLHDHMGQIDLTLICSRCKQTRS